MNANELADKLEKAIPISGFLSVSLKEAATMLRQQQAEIEALKTQNDNYRVVIEILRRKVKTSPTYSPTR